MPEPRSAPCGRLCGARRLRIGAGRAVLALRAARECGDGQGQGENGCSGSHERFLHVLLRFEMCSAGRVGHRPRTTRINLLKLNAEPSMTNAARWDHERMKARLDVRALSTSSSRRVRNAPAHLILPPLR